MYENINVFYLSFIILHSVHISCTKVGDIFVIQVCYYGNATSDLCYLIYTTSTAIFRQENLDNLLKLYFEHLISVIRDLGLEEDQYNPIYDEFVDEFYKVSEG